MSNPFSDRPLPPAALLGAGALIAFTVLSVGWARLNGFDASIAP